MMRRFTMLSFCLVLLSASALLLASAQDDPAAPAGSPPAEPIHAPGSSNSAVADTADDSAADNSTDPALLPTQSPACCQALQSMLAFLQAESIDKLQLPVLIVSQDDNGAMTAAKNKIRGSMCICGAPNATNYEWTPVKTGVRGSTSVRDFTRKSYSVNTKAGKIPFLGMPKGKKWTLYAPGGDTAFIRGWLAFGLWRQLGRWGPRQVWAEVFIIPNKTSPLTLESYHGLYMAGEKIWRGKHRINIDKYDPAGDPTGGFIFRIEHGKPHDFPQVATRLTSQIILINQPRKNVSDASIQYLTKFFNDFERQLLAPNLGNFSAYAAPDGLVDFFLANEVIKSANDGYRGSVYFWKDANSAAASAAAAAGGNLTAAEYYDADGLKTSQVDGRVVMGPVWDAAKALGLCCGFPVKGYQVGGNSNGSSGGSAISPEGWLFNICVDRHRCVIDPQNGLAQWYLALWRDQVFRSNTSSRYAELRRSGWSDDWFKKEVDSQASLITPAVMRTFKRWGAAYVKDKIQLPPPGVANYPASFNASISYLRDWVVGRLHWLDTQLMLANQPGAAETGNAGNRAAVLAAAGEGQPASPVSG